jgi:hypothetical protein
MTGGAAIATGSTIGDVRSGGDLAIYFVAGVD